MSRDRCPPTTAHLQELALGAETLDHLHGLGEVALVRDLDHVSPHALDTLHYLYARHFVDI